MYDIHCHILPNTDDGPKDMEQSVKMAQIAQNIGIKTIIATPHYIEGLWCDNVNMNKQRLELLNNELRNKKIEVEVLLGNEIYITPNILELFKSGEITTLNNSKYLLIELPMLDIPIFVLQLINKIRESGLIPIIAHPERNLKIINDVNILYNFIKAGCLVQINIPSINGKYGYNVKKTAHTLIKYGLVNFFGTDAHSPDDLQEQFKLQI